MNTKKNKLTALIITYNEVNHIDDVIKNIDFTDEIIVVDSFSNDGTYQKLLKHEHVITKQRVFKNFADQRNYALSLATHNWILFIDADERITKKLKNEILLTIEKSTNAVGFMVKRLYYFNKKRIRFSGFQSDTTYRLFKKSYVKYIEDKIVHEQPQLNGESMLLKNHMLHYCFDNGAHYKAKMEHYATLKANELNNKGKKYHVLKLLFRPIYKFIINYFMRLGFLDGKAGFIICYLSAYGVYYRYKTLKKLNTY